MHGPASTAHGHIGQHGTAHGITALIHGMALILGIILLGTGPAGTLLTGAGTDSMIRSTTAGITIHSSTTRSISALWA